SAANPPPPPPPPPTPDTPTDIPTATAHLRQSATDIPAEMQPSDIIHIIPRFFLNHHDNVLDVLYFFDVTTPAHVILRARDLENFSADIGIAHFDGVDHLAERDVVSNERVWIEIDLVLFYETTDRRDFGYAFHGRERVPEI